MTPPGAAPLVIRPLDADDVEAIVDLNRLCDIAETGHPDQEVLSWIRDGVGDYSAYGAFDDAGLAACGWVELAASGHVGFEADVRVRPGVDLSAGDPLLEAVRAVAAEADPTRPLHLFANASAARARGWLESHGAYLIRHFWRMRIELDEPVAPPVLPADVRIRKVRDDDADLETVFRIVDTAFEDHFGHLPGRTYPQWIAELRKRSGLDLSLWWVAEVGGEPMSALIGWQFPDDDGGEVGHVGTLGTLRAARGRGIGTAMLTTAFAEYHSRGLRAATLGVDAENLTGAVRLYESVGMHVNHDWVLYELKPLAHDET